MKLKTRGFQEFFLLLVFTVLVCSGLQFSPDVPLIPFSDFVRLFLIFSFSILIFISKKNMLYRMSLWQSILIYLLLSLFIWAIIGSFFVGEHFIASLRRSFLALGVTSIFLFSIFQFRPNLEIVYKMSYILIYIGSFVSFLSFIFLFFGSGFVASGVGTYFQTVNFAGLNLTHEVHLTGSFPRLSSITANPNTLGFYSGLSALLVIMLFYIKKTGLFFSSIFLFINLSALIISFSRGSMLAFFIALFLSSLLFNKNRLIIYSLLVLCILLATLPIYFDPLLDMIQARQGQGLNSRDLIWLNALEVFSNTPVFGVGFGLETEMIHQPAGIEWTMHNAYLVVLAETGVIGALILSFFLLTIVTFFVISIKREPSLHVKKLFTMAFCVVLFCLLRGMVESSIMRFTSTNFIFITFIGVAVSYKPKRINLNLKVS